MLKQVIKFKNGDYWYYFLGQGPDLQAAWTFNKVSGAENTIRFNNLVDCVVVPVEVHFEPKYFVVESKT